MGKTAPVCFSVVAIVEVLCTTGCALLPFGGLPAVYKRPLTTLRLYRVSSSNLDVWTLSVVHTLLLGAILLLGARRWRQRGSLVAGRLLATVVVALCQARLALNRYARLVRVLSSAAVSAVLPMLDRVLRLQTALLSKCVIVALLGKDELLPPAPECYDTSTGVGLLLMFASICLCSAGLAAQAYCVQSNLTGSPIRPAANTLKPWRLFP